MKCHVLNEDRWHRFLNDTLAPEEADEISRHLEIDCSVCDEFIANMSDLTELGLIRMRQDLLDEVQCKETVPHHIKDEGILVKHSLSDIPGKQKWFEGIFGDGLGLPAFAGGMVALFLITVGILPQLYLGSADVREIEQTLFQKPKGIASAASAIDMDFMTGHHGADGRLEFIPGINGETYHQGDLLFLKYQIAASGYVYVVAYQENKRIDVLYPDVNDPAPSLSSGEYKVPDGQEIMGYPLAGIEGRYMVVGIYSPNSLDVNNQLIPFIRQSVNISEGKVVQKNLKSLGKDTTIDTIYFDVGT